jgi:hypothetical protein
MGDVSIKNKWWRSVQPPKRGSWVKQIIHEAIAESDVMLAVLPNAQYTPLPKMAGWLA